MKYGSIKFKSFLDENGISTYFLHKSIKKRISDFKDQVTLYESITSVDTPYKEFKEELYQTDQDILQSIQKYLIERIQKNTTTDQEILIALKKAKWTKKIKEPELRKMGLQASLFWNTTILGKLKLVRIGDYTPLYYLLPVSKKLKWKKSIAPHKISKRTLIVETL